MNLFSKIYDSEYLQMNLITNVIHILINFIYFFVNLKKMITIIKI